MSDVGFWWPRHPQAPHSFLEYAKTSSSDSLMSTVGYTELLGQSRYLTFFGLHALELFVRPWQQGACSSWCAATHPRSSGSQTCVAAKTSTDIILDIRVPKIIAHVYPLVLD